MWDHMLGPQWSWSKASPDKMSSFQWRVEATTFYEIKVTPVGGVRGSDSPVYINVEGQSIEKMIALSNHDWADEWLQELFKSAND